MVKLVAIIPPSFRQTSPPAAFPSSPAAPRSLAAGELEELFLRVGKKEKTLLKENKSEHIFSCKFPSLQNKPLPGAQMGILRRQSLGPCAPLSLLSGPVPTTHLLSPQSNKCHYCSTGSPTAARSSGVFKQL